jgi:hypothetical protein
MSFLPAHRLGIVVMANTGDLGGALTGLTAQAVYGILTGGAPISADSLAVLRGIVARERENIRTDRARRAARPQTMPLPFAAYAGRYENPRLGSLVLELNPEGKLEARAGAAWSAVEVYDGTRHQLRVELFGSGSVLAMNLEGDRVVGATLNGQTFRRARE